MDFALKETERRSLHKENTGHTNSEQIYFISTTVRCDSWRPSPDYVNLQPRDHPASWESKTGDTKSESRGKKLTGKKINLTKRKELPVHKLCKFGFYSPVGFFYFLPFTFPPQWMGSLVYIKSWTGHSAIVFFLNRIWALSGETVIHLCILLQKNRGKVFQMVNLDQLLDSFVNIESACKGLSIFDNSELRRRVQQTNNDILIFVIFSALMVTFFLFGS